MKPIELMGYIFIVALIGGIATALGTPSVLLPGYGITFTNNISLEDTINVNLTHAQMWIIPDGGITTTINAANTSVNITGISNAITQGITFTPNNSLTILTNGTYKIDFSASFSGATGNQLYGYLVGKGGVDLEECHVHRRVGNPTDIGSMGGTCIIKLVENDTLSLMVENEAAASDATFKDVSITVVQIN